jgi:RimJ/RimL family protein N-acetyltransferase
MTSLHDNLANWTQRSYPKEKIFEGRFIRLEPIDPLKHLDGLCDIFLYAKDVHERFRYLFDYPPKDKENIINWLEGESKPSYRFAIVDKEKEKVVGNIRFHHIVPENGTLELGLYFSSMISKTPGGTEAIYLLAKHVFDDLGYRR